MKNKRKNILLNALIVLQCTIYIFIPLRIVIIGTLIITCLFYSDIRIAIHRLLLVTSYCIAVFFLFIIYFTKTKWQSFLGVDLYHFKMEKDPFFHEDNTLYFVLISSKHFNSNKKIFEQAFAEETIESKKDCKILSMLNLDDSKAYEGICIMSNNAKLVYVNDRVTLYEKSKHNAFSKSMNVLENKFEILKRIDVKLDAAILFSIRIPDSDSLWSEYNEMRKKKDKLCCIISTVGFKNEFANAIFYYGIFHANESLGLAKFQQKNELKLHYY